MIRFECPACNAVMKASARKAGQKMKCLKCGQRLQIPGPPQGTVLAKELPPKDRRAPEPKPSAPGRPPPQQAEIPPPGKTPEWLPDLQRGERPEIPATATPAGQLRVHCPSCKTPTLIPADGRGQWFECPQCKTHFAHPLKQPSPAWSEKDARNEAPRRPAATPPRAAPEVLEEVPKPKAGPSARKHSPADVFDFDGPANSEQAASSQETSGGGVAANRQEPQPNKLLEWLKQPTSDANLKHSGLGMASFLIALLVGGLDVLLMVVVALNIAGAAHHRNQDAFDEPYFGSPADKMKMEILGGGVSLLCLNIMSVPLCLVGVGLAIVGLVGHWRDRKHLFSWIGLLGNGVVILGLLGLYVLAAIFNALS